MRLANWTELVKTLKDDLANIPPPTEIETMQEFNDRLKVLNIMIQNTIKKHIKLTTPSPYLKRWWTKELASEKKKMQQLGGDQDTTDKIPSTQYMMNPGANTTVTRK